MMTKETHLGSQIDQRWFYARIGPVDSQIDLIWIRQEVFCDLEAYSSFSCHHRV